MDGSDDGARRGGAVTPASPGDPRLAGLVPGGAIEVTETETRQVTRTVMVWAGGGQVTAEALLAAGYLVVKARNWGRGDGQQGAEFDAYCRAWLAARDPGCRACQDRPLGPCDGHRPQVPGAQRIRQAVREAAGHLRPDPPQPDPGPPALEAGAWHAALE